MKKDAYYFPHFSNARNDSRIIKLRRVLGIEGYGIYFMLLEVLREQTDFQFPLSGIEDLSFEWHTSKEKIASVIKDFDLFIINELNFFSEKLIYYLQPYLEKSQRAIEANKIRWSRVKSIQMDSISNPNQNPIKVKKSKEKKSKSKKNKIDSEASSPQSQIDILENKKKILRERYRNSLAKDINQLYPSPDVEIKEEIKKFISYWCEPNKSYTKMRFEQERTWDTSLRLKRWFNNSANFNKKISSNIM